MDRQTDRQMNRQMDRQIYRQMDKWISDTWTDDHTEMVAYTFAEIVMLLISHKGWTDRQMD